jgi:lipoprotein signal peptidase
LPVSLPISSSIYYMVMFYWKKRKSSKWIKCQVNAISSGLLGNLQEK